MGLEKHLHTESTVSAAPDRVRRAAILIATGLAVPPLLPLRARVCGPLVWPGLVLWSAALFLVLLDRDPALRRRMAVLLGVILVLALAPINTGTGNRHFLVLAGFFLAVLLAPALLLRRSDPGVITWRILPRRFRWRDVIYVLISIPLSWAVFLFYFRVNPGVPYHWVLPALPFREESWRLIVGINLVGIWDELFFINTVYALLRSVYPRRPAIAAQGVVYASVLTTMAFTGLGPFLVYLLALTQGAMYEGSRSLIYVLLVHLIIDVFLVAAILHAHYPGMALGLF